MIAEFFNDKEIFITGGSGIVGVALVEQLLRSCNVRKIYLLLRPKKNWTFEQRLAKVKDEPIFRQLKTLKPNELDNKLVAVAGDATLPMLGITSQAAKLLTKVSIIYHCAATIRFDEALKDALKLNVGGTLEALKFAQTLKELHLFMHVSTFFSNPYLTKVDPKIYEAPMDWKFCLSLLNRNDVDDEVLDIITRKLIMGFPNTYTFTKNLAESLVNDHRDVLPVCIYRPSIVIFALEDPEPGFSTTLTGVTGLFAVTGAGLLKTIYIKKSNRLDFSPQDVVVKNMLWYSRKTMLLYEQTRPKDIPVYMTSSCTHCKMTLIQYLDILQNFGLWEKGAFEKNLFLPGIYNTSNRLLYMIMVFLLQLLPALLIDGVLKLMGRQPAIMSTQRKVFHTLEVLQPFMFNNYDSDGITDFKEINEQCENTNFNLEIMSKANNLFTNVSVCSKMVLSVRRNLLKEDIKTLQKSRKIFRLKLLLYRFIQFYLLYRFYLLAKVTVANLYTGWQQNNLSSMD